MVVADSKSVDFNALLTELERICVKSLSISKQYSAQNSRTLDQLSRPTVPLPDSYSGTRYEFENQHKIGKRHTEKKRATNPEMPKQRDFYKYDSANFEKGSVKRQGIRALNPSRRIIFGVVLAAAAIIVLVVASIIPLDRQVDSVPVEELRRPKVLNSYETDTAANEDHTDDEEADGEGDAGSDVIRQRLELEE